MPSTAPSANAPVTDVHRRSSRPSPHMVGGGADCLARVEGGAYGLAQEWLDRLWMWRCCTRSLFPRAGGGTYEQFEDAWMLERVEGHYSARTSVGRSVSNDRQVITILELDVAADDLVPSPLR